MHLSELDGVSCLDDFLWFLEVFLFLAWELTNDRELLTFSSTLLKRTGKELLNIAIDRRIIPTLALGLLGSRTFTRKQPLGTVIGDEGVVVVVVEDWIHDLMDCLYFDKNSRIMRFGEVFGDCMVHLAHVLGQNDVEVYDVLELIGIVTADCVN